MPVRCAPFAHPVRVALLELLGRDGPITATQAGEALGESPANASFHLRTLAKYGFVEEAPGGTGRQRPWRRVAQKHAWGLGDDPTTAAAAEGLTTRFFEQRIDERRQVWNATRASYPKEWQEAAGALSSITYMTAAELDALGDEIMAIIDRYAERVTRPLEATRRRAARRRVRHRPSHRAHSRRQLALRSPAVGDPVQDVIAAVAAREPVDERERVSIEHFLAEVPRLDRSVRRARRSRAHHRVGAGRRTPRHRAAATQVARHLAPARRAHRRRRAAVGRCRARSRPRRPGSTVRLTGRSDAELAHVDVHAGPRGHTHLDLRYLTRGRRRRSRAATRGEPGGRLVRLGQRRWPWPIRASPACCRLLAEYVRDAPREGA